MTTLPPIVPTIPPTMARQPSRRAAIGRATALAASFMAAPGLLRAQQKFVCRIGHSEAVGAPLTMAFETWTKALNEKSGGRITAQHFPASQLGSYSQNIEQNRMGTIQVTTGGPDTEETIAPEIAATGGAPGFIYKDDAHVDRVLQGDIGKDVSRIAREKTGVEFVAFGEVGFRHILSKKPVLTMADIKGTKIRTPEVKLWVDFWRAVGSSPTPLPYAEQYSALSTGLIDALESDVFSVVGFKWHEQARHLTMTSHWFLPKAVRVNAKWLDSLPPDLQALVRSSAVEAFAEQRKVNRANAAATLEQLKKAGVTVHQLTDMPVWRQTTAKLFDEFGAKSPATKTMIDRIRALA
jgi:tripartite ATP-independent transporter DctP family solute receptor